MGTLIVPLEVARLIEALATAGLAAHICVAAAVAVINRVRRAEKGEENSQAALAIDRVKVGP